MEYKVVIFLCGLTIFTFADSNTKECKYKKTEGEQLEIELKYPQLKDNVEIKWTKGSKVEYHKKRVNKLKPGEKGSLVFSSVTREHNGTYDVKVYEDGKQKFEDSIEVCVYEKLDKPKVNFTCDENIIKIACNVHIKDPKNTLLKWVKNGKENKELNKANFEIKNPVEAQTYKCIISTPINSLSSDEVKVTCSKSTLFGIDFWLMVIILAAGGGLVLLLTIVLLACSCYRCQRKKQQEKDEEELRLSNFPQQYGNQKLSHTARGQPAPPVPEYEVTIHPTAEDSGKRNQRYVRPPPPPVDEDEQPPPLPQPRKKVHTKNNSGAIS